MQASWASAVVSPHPPHSPSAAWPRPRLARVRTPSPVAPSSRVRFGFRPTWKSASRAVAGASMAMGLERLQEERTRRVCQTLEDTSTRATQPIDRLTAAATPSRTVLCRWHSQLLARSRRAPWHSRSSNSLRSPIMRSDAFSRTWETDSTSNSRPPQPSPSQLRLTIDPLACWIRRCSHPRSAADWLVSACINVSPCGGGKGDRVRVPAMQSNSVLRKRCSAVRRRREKQQPCVASQVGVRRSQRQGAEDGALLARV